MSTQHMLRRFSSLTPFSSAVQNSASLKRTKGPPLSSPQPQGLVFLSVPSNFQTRTQSFDGRQAGEGEGTQAQVGCLQIRTQYESMPGEHMGSHQLLGSLGPCLLQQARSFQEVRLTRTESPEKKKRRRRPTG